MIILTLFTIIILLCLSLYLLKIHKIEFYEEKPNKKYKCVTVTPTDSTNMDCGTGLYMQSILNVPGNSTQLKCCKIK